MRMGRWWSSRRPDDAFAGMPEAEHENWTAANGG
jgi:hypothetical protein